MKSLKLNLEKSRFSFFQIGLIIALSVVLFAFELKNYDKNSYDLSEQIFNTIDDDIVLNKQIKKPPPPPEPFKATILNIVDDNVFVDDIFEINVEDDQDIPMKKYVPVYDDEKNVDDPNQIFIVVETKPQYVGGEKARIAFLQNNLKYPKTAHEIGISGTVLLSFVVEKDGSVSDVKIDRGIGGGCDEESIKVLKAMPKWIPGKQRGKPVRVRFNMKIKFTLSS